MIVCERLSPTEHYVFDLRVFMRQIDVRDLAEIKNSLRRSCARTGVTTLARFQPAGAYFGQHGVIR